MKSSLLLSAVIFQPAKLRKSFCSLRRDTSSRVKHGKPACIKVPHCLSYEFSDFIRYQQFESVKFPVGSMIRFDDLDFLIMLYQLDYRKGCRFIVTESGVTRRELTMKEESKMFTVFTFLLQICQVLARYLKNFHGHFPR